MHTKFFPRIDEQFVQEITRSDLDLQKNPLSMEDIDESKEFLRKLDKIAKINEIVKTKIQQSLDSIPVAEIEEDGHTLLVRTDHPVNVTENIKKIQFESTLSMLKSSPEISEFKDFLKLNLFVDYEDYLEGANINPDSFKKQFPQFSFDNIFGYIHHTFSEEKIEDQFFELVETNKYFDKDLLKFFGTVHEKSKFFSFVLMYFLVEIKNKYSNFYANYEIEYNPLYNRFYEKIIRSIALSTSYVKDFFNKLISRFEINDPQLIEFINSFKNSIESYLINFSLVATDFVYLKLTKKGDSHLDIGKIPIKKKSIDKNEFIKNTFLEMVNFSMQSNDTSVFKHNISVILESKKSADYVFPMPYTILDLHEYAKKLNEFFFDFSMEITANNAVATYNNKKESISIKFGQTTLYCVLKPYSSQNKHRQLRISLLNDNLKGFSVRMDQDKVNKKHYLSLDFGQIYPYELSLQAEMNIHKHYFATDNLKIENFITDYYKPIARKIRMRLQNVMFDTVVAKDFMDYIEQFNDNMTEQQIDDVLKKGGKLSISQRMAIMTSIINNRGNVWLDKMGYRHFSYHMKPHAMQVYADQFEGILERLKQEILKED